MSASNVCAFAIQGYGGIQLGWAGLTVFFSLSSCGHLVEIVVLSLSRGAAARARGFFRSAEALRLETVVAFDVSLLQDQRRQLRDRRGETLRRSKIAVSVDDEFEIGKAAPVEFVECH